MTVHISDLPRLRRQMVTAIELMIKEEVALGVDASGPGRARRMWDIADLFYVTEDMTQVALEANETMPPVKIMDVIPSDVGFIYFGGQLPALPNIDIIPSSFRQASSAFGGLSQRYELPVHWIVWRRAGTGLYVEYGTTREAFQAQVKQVGIQTREFTLAPYPLATMGAVTYDDVVIRKIQAGIDDPIEDWCKTLLLFLGTVFVLMGQPSVAEKKVEEHSEQAGSRRSSSRVAVTTVSLRRVREVHVDRDEATGRKLTHQHYVRAHVRNQAHGPGRSQRKLIAIAPFIKGPAGAELIQRERVTVWRR